MNTANKNISVQQNLVSYHKDPTLIFRKLCYFKPFTLLLESAEIKNKAHLKSMLIVDSAIRITAFKNIVYINSLTKNGHNFLKILDKLLPKDVKNIMLLNGRKIIFKINYNYILDEDRKIHINSIFDILRLFVKLSNKYNTGKIPFFFGGLFSYDLISNFEYIKLFKPYKNKKQCPDFCFYLSENLLIFNHKKKTCMLQTSFLSQNKNEKKRIYLRIKQISKILNQYSKKYTPIISNINELKINKFNCNKIDEKFSKMIKKVQKKIKLGEIFQTVISRIFNVPCSNSLTSYENLKYNNPSPYMFFMQDLRFTLFGASPESSLKYNNHNRYIEIHPIAGTRPRGVDSEGKLNFDLDSKIELEMRTNKKELSEHIMLVDLARNDLAKICVPGTRYVSYLTKVDKYLHVMHLVSKVIGILRYDLDVFHAYCACMNMGTLTGAPKVRAMEIIAEIEQDNRYSYGGSIGYFNSLGKLDTCIIIRSAYIEKKIAYIQAGSGIVIESKCKEECEESKNKAKAVISSIIQINKIKG